MATYEDKWFEVWYGEGVDVAPSYLLIVTPDKDHPQRVVVIDPLENFQVIHSGESYEDTWVWLREDEYIQVEAINFPDDGW